MPACLKIFLGRLDPLIPQGQVAAGATACKLAHMPLPATVFAFSKLHVRADFLLPEYFLYNRQNNKDSNHDASGYQQILNRIITKYNRIHYDSPWLKSVQKKGGRAIKGRLWTIPESFWQVILFRFG